MNFRELNDAELAKLGEESDEKLVEYMLSARRASRLDAAVQAAQVLAFTHEERITAFVRNRLRSKGASVVDEVAERTLTDAISSAPKFEGGTIGEFRGWLFRIARNRIVDYHRKGRVDEQPLMVDWGEGKEEREIGTGDPLEAVDRASVFNQAFSELNEVHQLVIRLVRFRDLPHREIAAEVNRHFDDGLDDPMTEQNVNQINSRFDKRLDKLLDEAEDPPGPTDDD